MDALPRDPGWPRLWHGRDALPRDGGGCACGVVGIALPRDGGWLRVWRGRDALPRVRRCISIEREQAHKKGTKDQGLWEA